MFTSFSSIPIHSGWYQASQKSHLIYVFSINHFVLNIYSLGQNKSDKKHCLYLVNGLEINIGRGCKSYPSMSSLSGLSQIQYPLDLTGLVFSGSIFTGFAFTTLAGDDFLGAAAF